MEKELSKMKIIELHELKAILCEMNEKYSRALSNYNTNGLMNKMYALTDEEKDFLNKKIKNDKLIEKINNLIEEKLNKYYD